MTQHNKEELISVLQILLAIFISFTLVRFLSVFAANFNPFAAIAIFVGVLIWYLCLNRRKHFNLFFTYACIVAIPCSLLYAL